jgi:uncharacterized membrane protein
MPGLTKPIKEFTLVVAVFSVAFSVAYALTSLVLWASELL